LIETFFALPVRIPAAGEPAARSSLIESRRALAAYYLRSTTRLSAPPAVREPWWFTPGLPMLLVEYSPWEILSLPRYARPVETLKERAPYLAHCPLERGGSRLSVWFLRLDPLAVDRDTYRRLRLHLFRLHAERECLRHILVHIARGRITTEAGSEACDRLQAYLSDAARLLSREARLGMSQTSLLDAAQDITNLVSEGERASLLTQLQRVRPSVLRKVERLTAASSERSVTFHIVGGQQTIAVGTEQTIGGQIMTSYNINFGDHAVVSGNFVVASTIQNAFNKIDGSEASAELKEKLKTLSQAVAEMTTKLPKEQAEQAARDLETLTTEATSKTPRRKWYELSAEGLIEAAKTVGEMAAPVVSAVKAILPLLA
jgi:hypothetical protein